MREGRLGTCFTTGRELEVPGKHGCLGPPNGLFMFGAPPWKVVGDLEAWRLEEPTAVRSGADRLLPTE